MRRTGRGPCSPDRRGAAVTVGLGSSLGLALQATSRTNTIYMVCYFIGGALGSSTGGLAWHHFGWPGVCAIGFAYGCGAILVRFAAWSPSPARV